MSCSDIPPVNYSGCDTGYSKPVKILIIGGPSMSGCRIIHNMALLVALQKAHGIPVIFEIDRAPINTHDRDVYIYGRQYGKHFGFFQDEISSVSLDNLKSLVRESVKIEPVEITPNPEIDASYRIYDNRPWYVQAAQRGGYKNKRNRKF